MKVKTRKLLIKDNDLSNIRKDVLSFLSSSAYVKKVWYYENEDGSLEPVWSDDDEN